jgi:hypothetical protein
MATDVFDILVKIGVSGNHEKVLGSLISTLGIAESKVQKLIKSMGGLGAAAGVIGAGLAVKGVVDLGEHLVKAGAQVSDVAAKLKALGDTPVQIQLDIEAAQKVAQLVGGTTTASALQQFVELRSVTTNEEEARAVLQTYATAARDLALFNTSHGTQHDATTILPLLKAAELQGAFNDPITKQIDVTRINAAIKAAEAALELTNGVLTPSVFMRMTNLAGPAAQQVSFEKWIREMTEVGMAMGPTGGRGAMMGFKTLVGGNVTKAEAEALANLGLIKQADILKDNGHYSLKQGALQGYDILTHQGLDEWFHKIALPALTAKNGGKAVDDAAIMSAFASFPITMQRLLAFFNTNQAQIDKFGAQFDQRMGTDANKALMDTSVTANVQALDAAWQDMMQTFGGPLVQPAIAVLHRLTSVGHELSALGEIPGVAIGADGMLGAIGVAATLKTVAGATRMLSGLFRVLGGAEVAAGVGAATTLGEGGALVAVASGLSAIVGPALLVASAVGPVVKLFEAIDAELQKLGISNGGKVVEQMKKEGGVLLPDWAPGSGHFGTWWRDHLGLGPHGIGPDMSHPMTNDPIGSTIHRQSFLVPSGNGAGTRSNPLIVEAANTAPVYITLDGRVLAQIVSDRQGHALSLPQQGTSRFDIGIYSPSPGSQFLV